MEIIMTINKLISCQISEHGNNDMSRLVEQHFFTLKKHTMIQMRENYKV